MYEAINAQNIFLCFENNYKSICCLQCTRHYCSNIENIYCTGKYLLDEVFLQSSAFAFCWIYLCKILSIWSAQLLFRLLRKRKEKRDLYSFTSNALHHAESNYCLLQRNLIRLGDLFFQLEINFDLWKLYLCLLYIIHSYVFNYLYLPRNVVLHLSSSILFLCELFFFFKYPKKKNISFISFI